MKTSRKALILHGTMGSPDGNWFPWLKTSLEDLGYEVFIPILPTPKNQSLKNWIHVLKEQVMCLGEIDLVFGHSLGANFILHILENGLCKPENSILVSALNDFIGIEDYDALNNSFFKNFNWDNIKANSHNISIIHGDNDPYVPIKQAQDIANNLYVNLKIIKNGGHLNSENGYTEFPLLLDLINE